MEPRGEAEENVKQDGTRRTQSRKRVSHGLDRIRKIAKAKRAERFTALMHHVTPELLRLSYCGLAGCGKTIKNHMIIRINA